MESMQDKIKRYKSMEISTLPAEELYLEMIDVVLKQLKISLEALEKQDMNLFFDSAAKADKMQWSLIELFDEVDAPEEEKEALAGLEQLYMGLEKQIYTAIKEKDAKRISSVIALMGQLRNMWIQANGMSGQPAAK